MTLRQRLVLVVLLSIASIMLLGGSLLLSSQQRNENFTRLTAALDSARALSDVAVCVEDLQQQLSIQSQLLPLDATGSALDPATRTGIMDRVADCRIAASQFGSHSGLGDNTPITADTLGLLEVWEDVTQKLGGSEHSRAIQLLALTADPAARALIDQTLVQAQVDNAAEIDAARDEFLQTASTSDALLIAVGVLVLVAIASSLALMFTINRGVAALLSGARHFKEGELGYVIQARGGGELEDVASQMNEMAVALTEARSELQERAVRLEDSLRTLQQAQSALVEQAKMAALGNLVAGISHEVNTPLGVAVTATSYVSETLTELDALLSSGAASRRAVTDLMNAATEGCALSSRSLDRASELMQSFKQIAVDRSRGEDRTLEANAWAGTVLQSLKPLARRHTVEVVLHPTEPLMLRMAAGALEQVLTNLVVNSFTHAFPPVEERSDVAPPAMVTVQMATSSDALTITVKDTGLGMTPDVQQKVFDPFFTTRRGQGGTGLGMHIVHQIVTGLFEGSIDLQSPEAGGVEWHIRLPFETDSLQRLETQTA